MKILGLVHLPRVTPYSQLIRSPRRGHQVNFLETQPHSSQWIGDMGGGTVEVACGGDTPVDQVVFRCQVEGYVTTGLKYL